MGCGCGLIALMCAQRNDTAVITAIDIHAPSVEEAIENACNSPWKERVTVELKDFCDKDAFSPEDKYDMIVSNPPFFKSGMTEITSPREMARQWGPLNPLSLLLEGKRLLSPDGVISLVMPAELFPIVNRAKGEGLYPSRVTWLRGNYDTPFKRALCEFTCIPRNMEESILTVEAERGIPTKEYQELCKEFYLKY